MEFTIKIPEKVSLNKIYAGIHFRRRAEYKEQYAWAVAEADPEPWTGPWPVAMHYHFRIKGSRLDVSNHAYMLKMVEDGLVATGVLPDDTPQYIARVTITAEKADKDADDEVDIHISPAE